MLQISVDVFNNNFKGWNFNKWIAESSWKLRCNHVFPFGLEFTIEPGVFILRSRNLKVQIMFHLCTGNFSFLKRDIQLGLSTPAIFFLIFGLLQRTAIEQSVPSSHWNTFNRNITAYSPNYVSNIIYNTVGPSIAFIDCIFWENIFG